MTTVRGTLRFGTLVLGVELMAPAYRAALDSHLRSLLHPPAAPETSVDLCLTVIEQDGPDASPAAADVLQVERGARSIRWSAAAGAASLSDDEAAIAMRPPVLPEQERMFSFSVFVQKLLQARGLVRLHAAGVAVGDRTAVFVGDKGAGKSTLSLALGQRGATVLGDDQLALQVDAVGRITVAGSYPGIRLTAETEHHFFAAPLAAPPVVLGGVAKKEVALGDVVPAAPYVAHAPTDLWFPRVGDRFAVEPMARRDALVRMLAFLTPLHRFADGRDRMELVDLVAALVDATTPRALVLSPDLADLDRLWDELSA